jgi:hypothetical protein
MRLRVIVIWALACCLSACGTLFEPEPVGIGRDRDELKQSPCACFEIRQNYDGWRVAR